MPASGGEGPRGERSPGERSEAAIGVAFGLAAYGAWALLPLYFRALGKVPALDIVAHRVVWSVVFLSGLLTARGAWGLRVQLRGQGLRVVASSVFLTVNWLLYVWAVKNGRVLEASLGYFINPLVNVLLGRIVLGEVLTRAQAAAVGMAALGVTIQAVMVGHLPWVSLTLAGSFGLYGLLRKGSPVDGTLALLVETGVVALPALGWVLFGATGGDVRVVSTGTFVLLLGTGVATALPLLWFAAAARRLRLSTMGVLQYLAPTGQFLLGIYVFGEAWSAAQAVTFACIWAGVIVYTVDALRRR